MRVIVSASVSLINSDISKAVKVSASKKKENCTKLNSWSCPSQAAGWRVKSDLRLSHDFQLKPIEKSAGNTQTNNKKKKNPTRTIISRDYWNARRSLILF